MPQGSEARISKTCAMLNQKSLDQFTTIYSKRYGVVLTQDEAIEKATRLLLLIKAIYKPIQKS